MNKGSRVHTSKMGKGQKFVQSTGQDKNAMKGSMAQHTGAKIGGSATNLSHSLKGASAGK